jgi:hypothetical protein
MSETDVDLTPEQLAERSPEREEQEARTPFFTPRRLGATAPHDCSIWSVDYRDVGDSATGAPPADDTRRLEDESLTEQLQTLMDAGLQVQI